jgi:hypothetical protein
VLEAWPDLAARAESAEWAELVQHAAMAFWIRMKRATAAQVKPAKTSDMLADPCPAKPIVRWIFRRVLHVATASSKHHLAKNAILMRKATRSLQQRAKASVFR